MNNRLTYKPTRDSRIELLRIIAMLLIVICHFFAFMTWNLHQLPGWRGALTSVISDNGQTGVVLFFLITGYFLANRPFNAKGFARTWVQTFIYTVGFYVIAWIAEFAGHLPNYVYSVHGFAGIRLVLDSFLPCLGGEFWFISAYLILMLLSPFLNILLNHATRPAILLLIAGMAASSAFPLLGFTYTASFDRVIYGCTCYLIGGYIKKYPSSIKKITGRKALVTILICLILEFAVEWAARVQLPIAQCFDWANNTIWSLSACMIASGTVILLYTLNRSKTKSTWYSPFVNTIASCMFGVYLLHSNWLTTPVMYNLIAKVVPEPKSTLLLLAISMCLALIIFVVCATLSLIIDKIVIHPIQRLVVPQIVRGFNSLGSKVTEFANQS